MPSFISNIIETTILALVIVAECIFLWRMKRKFYWKGFAWLHALFLFLGLAVLPFWALAEGQFMYLIEDHIPLYWILMGLAYLFFILILWQVYFRQPIFVPTDTNNILDDYVED